MQEQEKPVSYINIPHIIALISEKSRYFYGAFLMCKYDKKMQMKKIFLYFFKKGLYFFFWYVIIYMCKNFVKAKA